MLLYLSVQALNLFLNLLKVKLKRELHQQMYQLQMYQLLLVKLPGCQPLVVDIRLEPTRSQVLYSYQIVHFGKKGFHNFNITDDQLPLAHF